MSVDLVPFDQEKHFKVQVVADWSLLAIFEAQLKFEIASPNWKILEFGHTFIFFIGPVPVAIKPYIRLNAQIRTKPLILAATLQCEYAERWHIGYEYKKDIDYRKTHKQRGRKWTSKETGSTTLPPGTQRADISTKCMEFCVNEVMKGEGTFLSFQV